MNSIEVFLQSVCRFISTEESAKDIRDELEDHISSYIEEYMDEGMDLDEATNKALEQMGDPRQLSELYKEAPYRYKGFWKILLITVFTCVYIFSKFMYDHLNFSDMNSAYITAIFVILFYGFFIFNEVKIHRNKVKTFQKEPLFFIQNYKTPIILDKIIKFVQLYYILEIALYLSRFGNTIKGSTTLMMLSIINRCSFNLIIVLLFSFANFSKNKSVVYEDGIFVFNKFIYWNSITGYRWNKDYDKGKSCYSLELKLTKNKSRTGIKVSSFQINLIEELFLFKNVQKLEQSYW